MLKNHVVTFCNGGHQIQQPQHRWFVPYLSGDNTTFGIRLKLFQNHLLFPLVVSMPVLIKDLKLKINIYCISSHPVKESFVIVHPGHRCKFNFFKYLGIVFNYKKRYYWFAITRKRCSYKFRYF